MLTSMTISASDAGLRRSFIIPIRTFVYIWFILSRYLGRQRFLAQRLSFHFFLEAKCAIFIICVNPLVKGMWRDFAGLNAAGAAVLRNSTGC